MAHCRKRQLSIFVNRTCSLACRYCYDGVNRSSTTGPRRIDKDFVKRGVLDYFANYASREIRFFANGEPTLDLDFIKEITQFALEEDESCVFELQTNGLFSEDTAKWISGNMDIVWISCDGPPEIQDYYRPTVGGGPSSPTVERNIRYLAAQPIILGCRATIGKRNLERQVDIIDYFHSLGVKAVMSDPMFASVNACNSEFSFEESPSLLDYAKRFLEAREYAESKGLFYGSILSANFDEETECACRACIPYPHLTVDGHVSACDMASDWCNSKMAPLIYGEYDKEKDRIKYDQDKIVVIKSRIASNMSRCQGCKILKNCAGACLGEALNETGSMFGIKPEVCAAIRYLSERMPLNKGLFPFLHP